MFPNEQNDIPLSFMRTVLQKEIEKAGSLSRLADRLGIAKSNLSEIMNGKRSIPASVYGALGFHAVTYYRAIMPRSIPYAEEYRALRKKGEADHDHSRS